jgi:transcriptional regulator with XRE-family HTH domain
MKTNVKKNGVKKIRTLLGMTQEAFANAIGVTPAAVSNYETGRRLPDPDIAWVIIDIAKNAGVEADLKNIYPRQ